MYHAKGIRMRDRLFLDALPYAAGAILLGLITIAARDFAFQWQPVPEAFSARAPIAVLSGILLILGALASLWLRAGLGRALLPLSYTIWVLALHVPRVAANPHLGNLLGLAEILSLAAAGWASMEWARSPPIRSVARILFGICPLVFGLSHFVYADITASMVPDWLPAKYFWAYFTGVAHFAAGAAILIGVAARIAASLLALMCGLFALLLHVPRVAAAPTNRMEWTMLGIAISIAGAAWLIRNFVPRQQAIAIGPHAGDLAG